MATYGASHENTILSGTNLAISLLKLDLWDEARSFSCDQLLPVARQSLGADHDLTLRTRQNIANALADNPERTRDNPRSNQHRSVARRRPLFYLNTGDDRLEAESMAQDLIRRRRRIWGPAHPEALRAEVLLSNVRSTL